MGETRVDLLHLLEDLRDAYPGAVEETILTEIVANSLDSGAGTIALTTGPENSTLTVVDDGKGMQRRELSAYHDLATTSKKRGRGIGFAGVGIKLGLLVCDEVLTETRRGKQHVATTWHLTSRRRAPWKWLRPPPGLVGERGTAVRLSVQDAFSALVDASYIETVLYQHFHPLFDPDFDELLSRHYKDGVRFVVNEQTLARRKWLGQERAHVAVRLPRKRKPSAVGYLIRADGPLPDEQRGIAISALGKVIKRGWDWIGVAPSAPDSIGGVMEAPDLAACLTLNKADFIRTGPRGATYLAYRKAIQEAVSIRLSEWGNLGDQRVDKRRRAARPMERDLETVLMDLAESFPLVSTLVERRAGGQRSLPIGRPSPIGAALQAMAPEARGKEPASADEPPQPASGQAPPQRPPELPPAASEPPLGRGPRRPTRYMLSIEFEARPDDPELARLVESTVRVNEAHPAYQRLVGSRAIEYHVALSTAMALAPLAVAPQEQHEFITAFLARWGTARDGRTKKRGKSRI